MSAGQSAYLGPLLHLLRLAGTHAYYEPGRLPPLLAPPLSGNRVFLAGESYSGHYLPLLAAELLRLDLVGRGPGQLDLRGLVPVNAWSDTLHDNNAAVEWWFGQGLISARVRAELLDPRR